MKELIMYKRGESSWPRWIKKRIAHNLNFVGLFTGPTGIGKSWTAIEIARLIDPKFDSVKQVAFSFAGLMRIINKFNNPGPSNLHKKKYKIVIFDEAQTDVNRHEWQSKTNKFLNYVLSTFRHQNIIVLFTTPYEDYIDSAALKLFHAKFECMGWSKATKKSRVKPKIFQYNAQLKKMYYKYLRVIMPGGGTQKMENWGVDCPPKRLTEPYETEKFAFTNALNMKITEQLEKMEREANGEDKENPLNNPRQEEIEEDLKENRYRTQKEVAERHNMTPQHLGKHFKWAKNKGHDWSKYKILEN